MFRYLVLGLLRSGEEQHGYALAKAYHQRAGASRINTGSFYRELTRLVVEGLVATAPKTPGADPRRAPYRITDDGVFAFDAWLSGPHRALVAGHDDDITLMVLFLTEADATAGRETLARLREDLWLRSKVLEREHESVRQDPMARDCPPWNAYALLRTRRQKQIAAEVEFLDELRVAYDVWLKAGGSREPARKRTPQASRPRRAVKEVR